MRLVLLPSGKRGVGLDSEGPPVHCLLAAYAIYSAQSLGSGKLSPWPFPHQAGPALTNVVKASWCQPLRQVRGEEKTSEQRAQQVVAMIGA